MKTALLLIPVAVLALTELSSFGAPTATILIPGTVGSRLVHSETGRVVWGEFSRKAANGRTDGAIRGMAFQMERGRKLSELDDPVHSDGILDIVPLTLLPGIKVRASYYRFLIESLREGNARKQQAVDLPPCLVFDYDWRRSGDENAARLARFVDRASLAVASRYSVDPEEVEFNLVTHSHGALIVRYYLMHGDRLLSDDGSLPPITWEGAEKVRKVVMMGPPHAGIPRVLRHLTHGYKEHPVLPFYDAAIVGTLPAIYQMLPRVRHHCLLDPDTRRPLDHFDPRLWVEKGWGLANPGLDRTLARILPEVSSREERRAIALDHLTKCLRKAEQFQAAIDRRSAVPKDLELACIGCQLRSTDYQYLATPGKVKILSQTAGDGTVPIYSTRFFCARLPGSRRYEEPYRGGRQLLDSAHNDLPMNVAVVDQVLLNLQ